MKILIEFDPAYSGPALDAVWIVDTPENRRWFDRQKGAVDANSAVFERGSDPLSIIWDIFEHHPRWSEINVHGATLTPEVEASVQTDAKAEPVTSTAFRLTRR